MKGNIVLAIGGVVVVGIAAYVIYKRLQMPKEGQSQKTNPSEFKDEFVANEYFKTKEEVASSITERHTEAAKEIKKSLQTILSEENEEIKTENSKALDKIDAELDNLLK